MSIVPLSPPDSGKPAVPPPFAVSAIRRAHGAWLYMWPFQSRKALVTTLCILTVGLLAWTLVVLLWLDSGALPCTLAGGAIGGVWFGPYRTLPAEMTITTRSDARYFVEEVKQLVLSTGYMVSGATCEVGHAHYCNKWRHKLRGWLSWDEQDVDLRWSENKIELHGPIAAIEWTRNRLIKQLEL